MMTRFLTVSALSLLVSAPSAARNCVSQSVCNPAQDLPDFVNCILTIEAQTCITAKTCAHDEQWYDTCVPNEDGTEILCFKWDENQDLGKACYQ